MTIDQIRAVLESRIDHYASKPFHGEGTQAYRDGKVMAYGEALCLLELIDGHRGSCPVCGSSMGSRLPDGRWRCAGLSSYAVLPSESCGHVYDTNHGEQP